MELWEEIPDFPDYLVSNRGLVINARTNRMLAQTKNRHGVVYVGMMKKGLQHKRAVARLVAKAFLSPPPESRFNTPVHLDGNPEHNHVENLVWRPRAFAHAYLEQLRRPYLNRIIRPIENVDTGEVFPDSFAAAKHYGLLERGVVMSALNPNTTVFPTGHQFRLVEPLPTTQRGTHGL